MHTASYDERLRHRAGEMLAGVQAPPLVYYQYLLKFALYIAVWAFFCLFNTAEAGVPWYFQADAFKKFVLWSLLFEGLGLGCNSGPLGGRPKPWFTAYIYFMTPGTMKVPFIRGLPVFGRDERSWLDAGLYILNNLLLLRALFAPEVLAMEHVLPVVIIYGLLGLSDRAMFLASRPEQYLYLAVCFLFAEDWVAGSKWVQFAIWMGAGISKLNHMFPYTIIGLAANHPLLRRFPKVKEVLVRSPTDLRPSALCRWITYGGMVVEVACPVLLALGDGGWVTTAALIIMFLFHLNIIMSVPQAVPVEWNIFVIYSMLFLFGHHAGTTMVVESAGLSAFLLFTLVGLTVLGNLAPRFVSFLISMRYYAGNWALSIWYFRGTEAMDKVAAIPVAVQPFRMGRKGALIPPLVQQYLMSRRRSRTLQLTGRSLQILGPRAVGGKENLPLYAGITGETIAGRLLGWNFADGHIHDERLLRSVQERCGFGEGELIHLFIESQPLHRFAVEYRITDAAKGLVERGEVPIADLRELNAWDEDLQDRQA